MQRSVSLARLQAFFFPAIVLLVGISILLTIYIGGLEVSRGRASTGNIAEFIVYIGQLTFPMMALGWVSSIIQRAAASQKRINEFLHTRRSEEHTSELQSLMRISYAVFCLK